MRNKHEILKREVLKAKQIEDGKPLIVSVMGQTGVGKSSLINALFDTNLKTAPVRPCTKEIEKISIDNGEGQKLIFYDLPGVGESDKADSEYIEKYIHQIEASDIIIWAIHSDNRSVTFDQQTLNKIYTRLPEDKRSHFVSKITFVLTKTDLLIPPAWIFGRVTENVGVFTPSPETQKILDAKKEYYREVFIKPYSNDITSTTYNDCNFNLSLDGFFFDEYTIGYQGFANKEYFNSLEVKYPEFKNVFERLNQNYEVIPSSSLFKFNLNKLLLILVNKLGEAATGRFKNFISEKKLNIVPTDKVKNYSNIIVFDLKTKTRLFDLNNIL